MGKHKYPDRFYDDPGAISVMCNFCKHFRRFGSIVCVQYGGMPPREKLMRTILDDRDCGNGFFFEPNEAEAEAMKYAECKEQKRRENAKKRLP